MHEGEVAGNGTAAATLIEEKTLRRLAAETSDPQVAAALQLAIRNIAPGGFDYLTRQAAARSVPPPKRSRLYWVAREVVATLRYAVGL